MNLEQGGRDGRGHVDVLGRLENFFHVPSYLLRDHSPLYDILADQKRKEIMSSVAQEFTRATSYDKLLKSDMTENSPLVDYISDIAALVTYCTRQAWYIDATGNRMDVLS